MTQPRIFDNARPARPKPAPLRPLPPPPDITVTVPIADAIALDLSYLPYDAGDRSLWRALLDQADEALRTHWNDLGYKGDAIDYTTSDNLTNDLTNFTISFTANHDRRRGRHFIDLNGKLIRIEAAQPTQGDPAP